MSLVRAQQGEPEKRPFSNGLFSIQSEGLVWNLTAGEYVIAVGVWHLAPACIFHSDWCHTSLRDDSIQTFGLIPYTPSAWVSKLSFSLAPLLIFDQQYMITIHSLTKQSLREVGRRPKKITEFWCLDFFNKTINVALTKGHHYGIMRMPNQLNILAKAISVYRG